MEPFEKYPSVITTFSKPRHFQGENDNVSSETAKRPWVKLLSSRYKFSARRNWSGPDSVTLSLAQLEKARKRKNLQVGRAGLSGILKVQGNLLPNFVCRSASHWLPGGGAGRNL